MKYRKQSHAVYYTRYNIVISTKYRRKVLGKGMGEYLKQYPEFRKKENAFVHMLWRVH
jgi:REP element-mobilizing transposase RayT